MTDQKLWQQFRNERITPGEILRRLNIRLPPIDMMWTLDQMGVTYMLQYDVKYSSRLDTRGGIQPLICVNGHEHPVRQRFAAAHALGHLMLHELDAAYEETFFLDSTVAEMEANSFVDELIMPQFLMNVAINRQSFIEMAAYLGVSKVAVKRRYYELYP